MTLSGETKAFRTGRETKSRHGDNLRASILTIPAALKVKKQNEMDADAPGYLKLFQPEPSPRNAVLEHPSGEDVFRDIRLQGGGRGGGSCLAPAPRHADDLAAPPGGGAD
eukprot:CAMPEP_0177605932 /NCGR_PEP_ID=MMETSP0419_2-20121207/17001_1 /TAXON_ID=582737 /ORGANISM="Tetraselmis sp., Strain GSL018" /LENGTH=109 /DNA_ID=CAMNT_0019100187 /DNA_START=189 /DNA_END=517 /DNA_ORIENTATION=-